MDRRDAQRTEFLTPGLGNENPSYRAGLRPDLEVVGQAQALLGRQRRDAVNARRVLPTVVLRHPSNREQLGRPVVQQELLETTNLLDVTTSRGLIDPLLELEHVRLDVTPGQRAPSIHLTGVSVHSVCTPWAALSARKPCPRRRIPGLSPRRWLLGQSFPPGHPVDTCSASRQRAFGELLRSSFLSCAVCRVWLSAGWRCRMRDEFKRYSPVTTMSVLDPAREPTLAG